MRSVQEPRRFLHKIHTVRSRVIIGQSPGVVECPSDPALLDASETNEYPASKDSRHRRGDRIGSDHVRVWRFRLRRIYCLAVSPDGTVAAAGSNHGRVLVWDLT